MTGDGTRPSLLVAATGTGTEVGKTWVTAGLLRAGISGGLRVAARKPVQSFEPGDEATDADLLAAATGEDPLLVCPAAHRLPVPMAPPMAAAVLGVRAPSLAALLDACRWSSATDLGVVETVGGLRSPVADDGDSLDLVRALEPDRVVLVADAGLGTINDCRLAADALADVGAHLQPIVVLNRFDADDDLHRRNRAWLQQRCGLTTVAVDPSGTWAAELVDVLAVPTR